MKDSKDHNEELRQEISNLKQQLEIKESFSIQAKGIDPDYMILEDVPDDLKGKDDTKGEASLKGHLKNGDDEKQGSQAYVPTDAAKDKQLTAALDLLHGIKVSSTQEPKPAATSPAPATDSSGTKPANKVDAPKQD